jgi:hypothetical protein
MRLVSQQFQARLEARVPPDATPEAAFRAVAEELLGAEPEQRTGSVLWTLRLARSTVDPVTAKSHAEEWQDVEDLLAGLLWASRPERGQDLTRTEAAALLALLDGLAPAVVVEPKRMPAKRAKAILAQHLDQLLGRSEAGPR